MFSLCGLKRTQFVKECVIATCIALAVIGCVYFYGTEVKQRSIWLTTKPMFPWAIAVCFFVYIFAVPYSKLFCFLVFLTYLLYGIADIIIELGDAMLAPGAIGFLIGHIVFIVAVAKSKKVQSETDLPQPVSKCGRVFLVVFLAGLYTVITIVAVRLITSYTSDIALIAVGVIYPLSFAVMSIMAVFCWRHKASLILNIIGALVYAASDIVTALQALVGNQPWMHYFIMPSYWVALLLFAAAALPVVFRAAGYDEQIQDVPLDYVYSAIPQN